MSPNSGYYGVSQATTESVDFYFYCKNVLPNEWIASWPAQSLESGAEAVKMYGWYHTVYPKRSDVGADVDDTTASQVFAAGTENNNPNTTNAINAMGGIGLMKNNSLFETQYRQGTYDGTNYAGTGIMSQWGTDYLANNNDNYQYIIPYYYPSVQYFSY